MDTRVRPLAFSASLNNLLTNRTARPQTPQFSGSAADTLDIRFGGRVRANLTERDARAFVRKHSRAIETLALASGEASWGSTCQGSDYVEPGQEKTNEQRETEADQAYKEYFNDKEAFEEASRLWGQRDKITDRLLVRQLEDLYDAFQDAGKSPELLAKENALMERTSTLVGAFNRYRAVVDGETLSNMAVTQRLEQTNDPAEARKLAVARNNAGSMVIDDQGTTLANALVDLVKKRNDVARLNTDKKGNHYSDYYSMSLDGLGIDEDQLVQLLDQIDDATRAPYEKLRAVNLKSLQTRYGISAEESAKTWYDSGGNNLKRLLDFDMKPYVTGKDPLALTQKVAELLGESAAPIFEKSTFVKNGEVRSSIYFDPAKDDGKSQHWFSFGINPPDDVRTFGSIDPNHKDMMDYAVETMLHETTGHGLDGKNISKRLPYLLRGHHSVTTESHAMLMENLAQDPEWFEKVLGLPKDQAQEVAKTAQRYNQANGLRQTRWMVSLIQFERAMYKNPDQDLNKLWWDLQEKYLGETRPEDEPPYFARVPHFFSHPVYYQNYFLADLARAQKLAYIKENFGSLLTKEAGDYLRTYRAKGSAYDWDDLVERMTGKPLSTDAMKAEFDGFEPPQTA